MEADGERLKNDVLSTAEFGSIDVEDGHGRTVFTGTEANRRARDYLVDRLEAVGCTVRIDAVGNVVGRWVPDGADPSAAPIASGSHLDSVRRGGIFDGPLGVYAAVEAVRTLKRSDRTFGRPLEVVCFTEEEGGRFADGLLGSSVATGHRSVEEALALTDDGGTTLEEALTEIGYRGTGTIDAGEWDAWLELHVEQGKRLESAGVSAGIVTSISGVVHYRCRIRGEANHAGTTPMDERTDAMTAGSELVLAVEREARRRQGESGAFVGTTGRVTVEPNATNVIPGAVTLGIDVRDTDADAIDTALDRLETEARGVERSRGVSIDCETEFEADPTSMDARPRDALRTAGDRAGVRTIDVHSGAFHDTMYVADVTDAGMLFAPSRDGASHSPREWTDWEDCTSAATVLAGALADLMG